MEKELFYVKLVGIIFDTSKRQILLKRTSDKNKYAFIEGNLNHDEELDKSLKKLIYRNTGCRVHNLGAVYVENMLSDKNKLKVHFLCEILEDEEKCLPKPEEFIWVKPSEVEEKIGVVLPPRLHEYIHNLE